MSSVRISRWAMTISSLSMRAIVRHVCHPERTREGAGFEAQSQNLREYTQDNGGALLRTLSNRRHHISAADRNECAGDKSREVRRQKRDGVGDVLIRPAAAEGDGLLV